MKLINTVSEFGSIKWRETPWDTKAFGFKTIEIIDLTCSSIKNGKCLLEEFQTNLDVTLIYGRFSASNQFIKKLLLLDNFFQCETSLEIRKNNLPLCDLSKIIKDRNLELNDKLTSEWKSFLVDKSFEMYKYTRFHEDPFIDIENSNKRISNWVKQLINNDTPILFHIDRNNEITCYTFYEIKNGEVYMPLGGALPNKGIYAPMFYGCVMDYFKSKGYKTIRTTVSAANKGILSLYLSLGFNVTDIKFDFHKHL